jgi:hypothetical protein
MPLMWILWIRPTTGGLHKLPNRLDNASRSPHDHKAGDDYFSFKNPMAKTLFYTHRVCLEERPIKNQLVFSAEDELQYPEITTKTTNSAAFYGPGVNWGGR